MNFSKWRRCKNSGNKFPPGSCIAEGGLDFLIAFIEIMFYNLSDLIRIRTQERRMSSLDKAYQTQIDNIQKKTGKSFDELSGIVRKSGLSKHGEIRDYLKRELGLGHGDANSLVHAVFKSDGMRAAEGKNDDAVLAEIYSGSKAGFR